MALTPAGRYSPRELIAARAAFECADTPIDAARSLPSYGPEWDPPELREQLQRERLWEKIDALGGPDPAWPDELRQRPQERRPTDEE